MRFVRGAVACALLLFVCGAVGLTGSWSLVASVVAAMVAAVATAIAAEERERAELLEANRPTVGTWR
jgi:hypothetical protein